MRSPSEQRLKRLLLSLLDEDEVIPPAKYEHHSFAFDDWVKAMRMGMLTGRPFSENTIKMYSSYIRYFLKTYRNLSGDALRQEFLNTPIDLFGRKDKFHRAVVSFAKFLNENNSLPDIELEQINKLKPKRHKPAKQLSITAEQLELLYKNACSLQNLVLFKLIATTGLRASECANLKISEIDLENQVLLVACGKGGKRRRVGFSQELRDLILQLIQSRVDAEARQYLFLDRWGNKVRRDSVLIRVTKAAMNAGFRASPHALRRAFVTLNANKGRSLVMLQIACGHSDIKTTRAYCRTSEEEVILAMRDW